MDSRSETQKQKDRAQLLEAYEALKYSGTPHRWIMESLLSTLKTGTHEALDYGWLVKHLAAKHPKLYGIESTDEDHIVMADAEFQG